jgi:ABC-type sugar transport system ATPase subunit
MIKLEVEKLSKHYAPNIVALDDVTLSVGAGECLALLGPSGGGKTTLLRLLAGLEEASDGEIRFDGEVVNGVPAHRRGVAMMFQRPALLPARTVRQNLRWNWELAEPWLPMQRLWGGDQGREEELARVARLLELERVLDRPAGQLSGGQQQRVALGQCLLRKTKVCLLDEPLGQLDAPLRTGLRRAIRQYAKEALAVGDRVAVFRHGRLVQAATPRQMRREPRDQFVAELIYQNIGGLNLLAGHIRQDGLDTYFESAFGRWPMLATTVSRLHQALQDSAILHADGGANPASDKIFRTDDRKSHIIIGVPAMDVRCTTAVVTSEEEVQLRMSYRDQESGWAHNWILGASEPGQWVGRTDDDERFEQRQTVTMIFSMAQAFWFDGATGRTLLAPTG